MKIQFTAKLVFNLLLITVMLFTASCKKEYADSPYSELVNFTIKDVNGESLKGALNNTDILLYWPPFQTVPDSITPALVVSENATVTPASGTKVPFNETTKFTVTAQSGATTVYTLKPMVNQPPLSITSFTDGANYMDGDVPVFLPGTVIILFGTNFDVAGELKEIYVDTEGGKTIPIPIGYYNRTYIETGDVAEYLTSGTYFTIRLVVGTRTVSTTRCLMGTTMP